ncbi:hypothetical protein FKM82_011381 [Ascaphus truei]
MREPSQHRRRDIGISMCSPLQSSWDTVRFAHARTVTRLALCATLASVVAPEKPNYHIQDGYAFQHMPAGHSGAVSRAILSLHG